MEHRYRTLIDLAENRLRERFSALEEVALANQAKVLQAFKDSGIREYHFKGSTGYGYDDAGREALDAVYARVFAADAALVRQQFVSGTHAIGAALLGNLRAGDELISITGTPYDTLRGLIGAGNTHPTTGSLVDLGITYREYALTEDGNPDLPSILSGITRATKMLLVQRSRGYSLRPALSMAKLANFCQGIREKYPEIIIFVDNCYGEFVEELEPTQVGADLIAGSLIKNPGGGLASGGGYLAGRRDLVEQGAYRLTMPGLGGKMGAVSGEFLRLTLQGFFMAPHVVSQALKVACLFASVMQDAGYQVLPDPLEERSDIVQAIVVGDTEKLLKFAIAFQGASPVDAHLHPEPWIMPGYQDPVVMASGSFIQGSSIELSLDAPLREPYIVFLQGGLSYEHGKLVLAEVLQYLGL